MVEENETEDTQIDALDMVEDSADLEDDEEFEGDDDLESADEGEEDEDEEDDASSRTADSDDDDDDEPDPDDVEEDLDTILKDRIASNDDEDEEDEEDEEEDLNPKVIQSTTPAGDVAPKREDEWTCEGCFFFVNARQFGRKSNPQCPSGEDPCPSFARL